MRSINIYNFESGSTEKSIDVNQDGTVTYSVENAGWVAWRKGAEGKAETMSIAEAKKRWPHRAEDIDKALAELKAVKV